MQLKRSNRIPVLFIILLILSLSASAFAEAAVVSDIPQSALSCSDIPPYDTLDTIILDENIPEFYLSQLTTEPFIHFSPLDSLGRTGAGFACLGPETLPAEKREATGDIQPSGWHLTRYDDLISDKYLYNRAHVIAYQLCGNHSVPENLFTGTRYLNNTSMKLFESSVAEYISGTGNHVLYRVTPIYNDDDLVATGVHMEAFSVEDNGRTICYNVFVYNIQPGILIDYKTGESKRDPDHALHPVPAEDTVAKEDPRVAPDKGPASESGKRNDPSDPDYILNLRSKKFHYPHCSSVEDMNPENKKFFSGSRDEVIEMGYVPCKRCNP